MRAVAEPVPVRDIFAALARDLGAREARPLRDGTILFEWPGGGRRRLVRWSPFAGAPGFAAPGLGGTLQARDVPAAEVARIASRLAEVAHHRGVRGVDPLFFPEAPPSEVTVDRDFARRYLGPFLVEGVSLWGDLLFSGARRLEDRVALDFEGPTFGVSFTVRPADAPEDEPSAAAGPVRVGLLRDSRPARVLGTAEGDVESYLLYALRRALPGCATAAVGTEPPPARARAEDPPGHDFPAGECPGDEGFFFPSARSFSCAEIMASCLAVDSGVSVVMAAANECARHYPLISSAFHLRHRGSRLRPLPVRPTTGRTRFVGLSEREALGGQDAPVRSQIREAAADPGVALVAAVETCLPECVGMPVRSLVDEEVSGAALPAALVRITMDDTTPIARVWRLLFQLARRDVAVERGVVNLVGFGTEDDPFVGELTEILRAAGLTVNGCFVPAFQSAAAERFLRAELTVCSNASGACEEFREIRADLAGMRYLDVAPPFGPRAMNLFLAEVGAACGRLPLSESGRSVWEPLEGCWAGWRARARSEEAALVVRPAEVGYLLEPACTYGIDLVACLLEMGFRVRVVLLLGEHRHGQYHARLLEGRFRRYDGAAEGLAVECLDGPVPARCLLERLRSRLVFSEHPSDARVWSAGLVPFHPADFQMGYGGALRTVARLVRLAEGRFSSVLVPSRRGGTGP